MIASNGRIACKWNRDGNKRDLEDEFHCFSYFQGCFFIYVNFFKLQICYLSKEFKAFLPSEAISAIYAAEEF